MFVFIFCKQNVFYVDFQLDKNDFCSPKKGGGDLKFQFRIRKSAIMACWEFLALLVSEIFRISAFCLTHVVARCCYESKNAEPHA